jgi:hypothetical protein
VNLRPLRSAVRPSFRLAIAILRTAARVAVWLAEVERQAMGPTALAGFRGQMEQGSGADLG